MQIKWFEKGKGRALAGIASAIALAAQLAAGLWQGLALPATFALALLMAALTFFAFGARVTVKRWWGVLIALGFISIASFLMLHLVLIHYMAAEPTTLMIDNSRLLEVIQVKPIGIARGICVPLILAGAVFALTADLKVFAVVWFVFNWAFGILDAAIYQFNGNVITINDIVSMDTALNVAGNYRLQILPVMITDLILFCSCMAIVLRTREKRTKLKRCPSRLAALACAILALILPCITLHMRNPSTFQFNGIRRNSVLLEFALELKAQSKGEPEGYSHEAVERLVDAYPLRGNEARDGQRPHVIAIMIEAFSDLNVLGDFKTNVDFMPFTRQLMQDSVSGYALVSTFGGGTARSEWEFLTGNTMGFTPPGSVPFRQFVGDDENSLVKVFENAGYHSIGIHPAKANGWGRREVYPALGFDETYFIDDLDWGETVRGFVSDSAFVHRVIDLFERRGSDPLFLFGVTIQNHGSYSRPDYNATVKLEGVKGDFPDVEQFLSLTLQTDDAVRELIEYFSNVDEPVQILLFGDHEPAIDSGFYDAVGVSSVGQRFLVPFLMWDNYEHRVESIPMTSINFLPSKLIDLTGIPKPAYYSFLSAVNEQIDAMNHMGYLIDGKSFDYDANSPVSDLLKAYRIYQYGNMFDHSLDTRIFTGQAEP